MPLAGRVLFQIDQVDLSIKALFGQREGGENANLGRYQRLHFRRHHQRTP
jgi:hypothetical protein